MPAKKGATLADRAPLLADGRVVELCQWPPEALQPDRLHGREQSRS